MYSIIGSGFGLYGYLPALILQQNNLVVLPVAYREKLLARQELAFTLKKIRWVPDEDTALAIADTVILATRPASQFDLVRRCLEFPNIRGFILEKPVSTDPSVALGLLDELNQVGAEYAVAYTLEFTSWQPRIIWPTRLDEKVVISWNFMAHHFTHDLTNWKRKHSQGGGVLRFFGIHIIAMLAQYGYQEVQASVLQGHLGDEPYKWDAVFLGVSRPPCYVSVNSRSDDHCFLIESGNPNCRVKLLEPFAEEKGVEFLDRRVPVLARMIDSFETRRQRFSGNAFYTRVNDLWAQAEAYTPSTVTPTKHS